MPTLTLNSLTVPFTPGSSVLDVARQQGVRIPTLCYHPILKSVGACRLCVVEVDGLRGFPTACTTPAADGMVVRTDTPALRALRREVLSLILSEHPYTCLVCDRHERCAEWQVTIRKAAVTTGCENCPKNGQCELQTLVDEVGLSLMPYSISYRGVPVEKKDPFFDRDYNLCILCGRCVRVCQDVRRTGTLAFVQRGSQTLVGTAFGQSHLAVDCEFCGSCVDVCPTGALYDKRSKWEGAPETTARAICPYCSVGCELDLWIKRGKVMGVRPAGAVLPTGALPTPAAGSPAASPPLAGVGDAPLPKGGRGDPLQGDSPATLPSSPSLAGPGTLPPPLAGAGGPSAPLPKGGRGDPLQEASPASSTLNNGMACARGRFGLVEMIHAPDRLRTPLLRIDGRLSETSWEEALAFLAQKLPAYKADSQSASSFALLASPHLTSEAAYALQKFARQVMASPYIDAPTALPSLPAKAALVDRLRSERSLPLRSLHQARSILVIGANPRQSHPVVAVSIRQAQAAGAKLIVIDPRRTELAKRADLWLPVAPGADAPLLEAITAALDALPIPPLPKGGQGGSTLPDPSPCHCESSPCSCESSPCRCEEASRRSNPLASDPSPSQAAALLKDASPCAILYGSGVTHHPTAVATLDALHRLAARLDAGLIPLLGAANTLGVLDAGLVAPDEAHGYAGIVRRIAQGEIKALYLAGEMPALDELLNLDLLIVQDQFLSPNVAEYAHVVLPAASFAEISGTLVNFEGRAQRFAPAIPPVGESRPDWWIASALARSLGAENFPYTSSADVWKELESSDWKTAPAPSSPPLAGAGGSSAPLPKGGRGDPLLGDSPATLPSSPSLAGPGTIPPPLAGAGGAASYPFTLLLERNAFAYRASALTDHIKGMELYKSDEDSLYLSPEDARRLEIADGDLLRATSAHGSDTFLARLSPDLPSMLAFASINPAHGSALFPGMLPESKACPIHIEKATASLNAS